MNITRARMKLLVDRCKATRKLQRPHNVIDDRKIKDELIGIRRLLKGAC